jgi:enoyl-CoA hydratase/carnithine racemase
MNTASALAAGSFKTLTVRSEKAVLLVEISAPPMNLLGPELVRDLVSLIQHAEADSALRVLVFKSADPDYFISHVDVTRIKSTGKRQRSWWAKPRLAYCSAVLALAGS